MKNTSVILSTYTADVSGVCSALYELGGMVVIHDPSGCNSTYNTHDEPRWYDQDSLIFISGLSEIDAVMGSDDKLIEDIIRAARRLAPRFLALVQTPVPLMTGVDFEGIAEILRQETGLPVYFFPTSGMHTYIRGVNLALEAVAEHMTGRGLSGKGQPGQPQTNRFPEGKSEPAGPERIQDKRPEPAGPDRIRDKQSGPAGPAPMAGVNLLGVTPLDFSVNSSLDSVKKILAEAGFTIISCFAMGSSPEEIARAGEAQVNLVLSSTGILAAKKLRQRFGTPYVVGLPTGSFAKKVIAALRESIRTGKDRIAYKGNTELGGSNIEAAGSRTFLVAEAVAALSIREALLPFLGRRLTPIIVPEAEEELLTKDCIPADREEELARLFAEAELVLADPLYQAICPDDVDFLPLPHEAFSGRIYRDRIPDLTRPEEILRGLTGTDTV